MQNTIYATYRNPEMADRAFVELLERGASLMDLVAITRRTYQEPLFSHDAEPSDIPDEGGHGYRISEASHEPNYFEEAVGQPVNDPFGNTPGGIWLLDNLRYPGDLSACLVKLGFADQIAREMEATVLEGGAMLVLRVPSGPVEDLQAWEAIGRYSGEILAPSQNRPYLS